MAGDHSAKSLVLNLYSILSWLKTHEHFLQVCHQENLTSYIGQYCSFQSLVQTQQTADHHNVKEPWCLGCVSSFPNLPLSTFFPLHAANCILPFHSNHNMPATHNLKPVSNPSFRLWFAGVQITICSLTKWQPIPHERKRSFTQEGSGTHGWGRDSTDSCHSDSLSWYLNHMSYIAAFQQLQLRVCLALFFGEPF